MTDVRQGLKYYKNDKPIALRDKISREVVRPFTQIKNGLEILRRNLVWIIKKLRNATDGKVMYVHHPMHYAMFASVHRHLPDVKIVAKDEQVGAFLDSKKVIYTLKKLNPDLVIAGDYCHKKHYPIPWIKKIQIFHGIGCKSYIDHNNNSGYLCIVPGLNLKERLENMGVSGVEMIGYPKTDCFFDNSLNRAAIANGLNLDSSKKTILYSPTWGEMSSAPHLVEEISRLSSEYNTLVKLHDLSHPSWRDYYQGLGNVIFVEDCNITDYMFVADLMISDFSSAIFEYAQLYRPIVVYGCDAQKMKGRASDVSWWNMARRIHEPTELPAAVAELLRPDWLPNEKYIQTVDTIFAFRDGRAGERAASVIREFERR